MRIQVRVKTALKFYEWFFVNLYVVHVTRGKVYIHISIGYPRIRKVSDASGKPV